MLLTILAIIGKHQELPRERWQVYEHAAEVLVQHWDVNKHLASARPGADFLDAEDKKELLRRVALSMQQAEEGLAGNHVHREELQQEFEGYLTTRYGQDAATAKATAKAMIEQFRERNFVLSRYGAGLYGFVHRALLEYFCADALVRRFEKHKQLTLDELKTEVFDRYWSDESWHEVLRLTSSMLDERFSGEIIQSLIDKVPPPWPVTLKNQPFRNVALAAQCLAEARNVAAFAEQTTTLLRRVVELIEHAARTWELGRSDFRKQVLEPLVEVVNPRWAGREHTRKWFLSSGIRAAALHKEPWVGRLIGALFADSKAMHAHLRKLAVDGGHHQWRSIGLAGLVQGWRSDGQSLTFLKDRLIEDRDSEPRILAAELITDGWPDDPAILDLLQERAARDPLQDVRTAVLPLVGRLSQDAATLAFLCERALGDGSWEARRAAIQAIAVNWSGVPEALSFLRERAVRDDDAVVRGRAIYRIGRDFRSDSQTLPFLHDRISHGADSWDRASALEALGYSFHDDPRSRSLLTDRLVNDLHQDIRRLSGAELAGQWAGDPDVLTLLQERATYDSAHENRRRFIAVIADNWPDDTGVVQFLRERAESDLHYLVRSQAIREFALLTHDDPRIPALIRGWSFNDASAVVRAEARSCLARSWPGMDDTLPTLQQAAEHDGNEYARRRSLWDLAYGWWDDPKTLSLLRDRAIRDGHEDVRDAALRLIARGWPDHPGTLPLLQGRVEGDDTHKVRATAEFALHGPRNFDRQCQ